MVQPIKIHAIDSNPEQIRARHAEIEARLEQMGPDRVRTMLLHGGLPTEWNEIVHSWLDGNKLDPPKES